MFWKKTGLVCIVASALGIVGYAQTTKPRSANLQSNAGYLGVGLQDMKDAAGVLVTYVTGEPAVRAGIQQKDVIVEFNGQKTTSGEDLTSSILSKAPGTKVTLTVLRGNTKQNLTATLGSRPPGLPVNIPAEPGMTQDQIRGMMAAAGAVTSPRIGFDFVEMLPQLAAYFGVQEGVLVESVEAGTPAAKAGLKAGDVITKVNGMPVGSAREIFGIVRQSGKKIIGFTVFRNKKEMTLNIEMASARSDQSDRDAIN